MRPEPSLTATPAATTMTSTIGAPRSPEGGGLPRRGAAGVLATAVGRFTRTDTVRFAPGKLVPAALTVLATPVFARVLGPTSYGVLSVATTFTLLGAALLFGWSEIVAVRELVDAGSTVEQLCSQASLVFVGAIALGVGATAVAAATGGNYVLVGAVAATTVAWGATTFFTGAMRGRGDANGYVRTAVIGSSGRAVFGVPAAIAGAGPAGVIFGWCAGAVVAAALAARRLRVRFRQVRLRLPAREFVMFAAPAVGVASGFLLLSLADRALLALFRSSADVGTYSLGYSLVEQSLVLGLSILQASGFPRLLRVFTEHGASRGGADLAVAITRALTVCGVVALPMILFGQHILVLVGGAAYGRHSAGFMQFVVVGVLLLGVGQYLSVPLQHARRSASWALIVGASAVANLLLNVALIPPFGLLGAGIATALGYGCFVALTALTVRKVAVTVIPHLRLLPWTVCCAAGAAVGLACLAAGVWLVGCVAAPVTYVVVALIFTRTHFA